MRIKRRRRETVETPALSDLAFLLIVYFIVIAGFSVNRGFLLDLPRNGSARRVNQKELLRFGIDKTGTLLLREHPVASEEAEKTIRSALAANPNTAVLVAVNGGAPWQSVVSFVELAKHSAVDSLSFRMEDGENEGTP